MSRFKDPHDFRPVAVLESTESTKSAEGTLVGEMSLTAWNGDTLIQYLRCQHCQNITMIVNLDQSYVLTLSEAEDLISEGYTAILPVTIQQIDTELNESLSFWFRVTYDRLHKQAETLRNSLNSLEDHGKRASRFEKGMSPILADVLREIKKQEKLERLNCAAREVLKDNWERIGSDSRELLTAANLVRNDLLLYAQVKPELDFVAPVLFMQERWRMNYIPRFLNPLPRSVTVSIMNMRFQILFKRSYLEFETNVRKGPQAQSGGDGVLFKHLDHTQGAWQLVPYLHQDPCPGL